jgi:hypothetical protein
MAMNGPLLKKANDMNCNRPISQVKGSSFMFEVVVKLKTNWLDLSCVSDIELFQALSDWSSGKEEIIKIKSFSFNANEIVNITISR